MARAFRTAVILLLLICAVPARAAVLFDPALRFRVLPTDHFVIYFHRGEEALAQRLALIAEETWRALRGKVGSAAPPPLTHVVLADQGDLANGYATPLPYNTIVVTAVWPAGSDFIGNTDDWLRLVFTHEYTHIVHLDRSAGGPNLVRRLFGRTLVAFPNLLLPTWQIEGLATFHESALTGTGRVHAGDFSAIVNEAARAGATTPLNRLNGGLTDWPGGLAAYAYGVGFHQYLADRYGPGTLGRLADATARSVPFFASGAFRRVYGRSLEDLWNEYQLTLPPPSPPAADANVTRLTHHGFTVSGPRFDRQCAPSCIVYSVRTPHGFPALNRIALTGGEPERLTTRYLGSTTAIGKDVLYFDQQEYRRNVGLYSDLYALSRATGRVTPVTNEARVMDPDLSPDGPTLVAVQDRPGQRDLVFVRVGPPVAIDTVIAEPETQFDAPRWSPDGRTIAVERHRRDGLSEIVLVDVATKAVRVLASAARTRFVTPAWHPDGRAVVAAMARRDETFNLYEFPIDGSAPRRLTQTTGGATWPDISADGRTLVFVGYTVDGFDLFSMPYSPVVMQDVRPAEAADSPRILSPSSDERPAALPSFEYSPLLTLKPTSWAPVIESDAGQVQIGAAVSGFDVLGYHGYFATVTWRVSSPANAPAVGAAEPDWQVAYAYNRWRPILWAAAKSSTSFFEAAAGDDGVPAESVLRAREIAGGITLPVRHARLSTSVQFSMVRALNDYTLPDRFVSQNRSAARGAWALNSAHTYGYSISPEGGITAGSTAEVVRPALGSFAAADTITADVRGYVPMPFPRHVLAIRAAGGRSTGDRQMRRTFLLGGASPQLSVVDFGSDAISLLRGFPLNAFAASHVALVNADYRFPIARPQRGIGNWPFFLHTIHAAVFADAGHTWPRRFAMGDVKTSAGVELSANIVLGYYFPFTVTTGVGVGHDGSGTVRDGTTVYLRFGRAF